MFEDIDELYGKVYIANGLVARASLEIPSPYGDDENVTIAVEFGQKGAVADYLYLELLVPGEDTTLTIKSTGNIVQDGVLNSSFSIVMASYGSVDFEASLSLFWDTNKDRDNFELAIDAGDGYSTLELVLAGDASASAKSLFSLDLHDSYLNVDDGYTTVEFEILYVIKPLGSYTFDKIKDDLDLATASRSELESLMQEIMQGVSALVGY